MKTKKFDYSKNNGDIFYKIIYPVFPKEFLYGGEYEYFAWLVSTSFILNETQWENILKHWEEKERILIFQ